MTSKRTLLLVVATAAIVSLALAGCTPADQDAVKSKASGAASEAASAAAGAAGTSVDKAKVSAAVLGAQATLTAAQDQAKANGVTLDQAQVDALNTKLTELKNASPQTAAAAVAAVDTGLQGIIDQLNATAGSSTGVKQIAAQKIAEALTKAKTELDAQLK